LFAARKGKNSGLRKLCYTAFLTAWAGKVFRCFVHLVRFVIPQSLVAAYNPRPVTRGITSRPCSADHGISVG
jgi:hypothetical protein